MILKKPILNYLLLFNNLSDRLYCKIYDIHDHFQANANVRKCKLDLHHIIYSISHEGILILKVHPEKCRSSENCDGPYMTFLNI